MTYTVTMPPQAMEDEGRSRFIGSADTYEQAEAIIAEEVKRSGGWFSTDSFKISTEVSEAPAAIDRTEWLDADQLAAFEALEQADDLSLVDHHRHDDRYEPIALRGLLKMARAAHTHLGGRS